MKTIIFLLLIVNFLTKPIPSVLANTVSKKNTNLPKPSRKISSTVMSQSKEDIQLVLAALQDSQGVYIKNLKRLNSNRYKVDLSTESGKCISHIARLFKQDNSKRALFEMRHYECD